MSSNRHFVVISISRTVGLRNAPGLKEKVNNWRFLINYIEKVFINRYDLKCKFNIYD